MPGLAPPGGVVPSGRTIDLYALRICVVLFLFVFTCFLCLHVFFVECVVLVVSLLWIYV